MRLKLDENLPTSLAGALRGLGHDVDTVLAEGLAWRPDDVVWSSALSGQRMLITQDLDFSTIRRSQPGTYVGLVLVRLRSPSRKALANRVQAAFMLPESQTWRGCIVVVTDHKVRVRRPSTTMGG